MAERQYTPSTRTAPELRSPPKRMGVPIAAAPVDATTTRRRSGNAGDLDGSTPASNPVPLQKIAVGKPGYDARVPSPPKNKPSRPASGRPPDLPFSRKSPEAAAKQVVANAAAMGTPKAKPTPAPKQSWWDKFSEDHKLSAAKSYANYKKLMESM